MSFDDKNLDRIESNENFSRFIRDQVNSRRESTLISFNPQKNSVFGQHSHRKRFDSIDNPQQLDTQSINIFNEFLNPERKASKTKLDYEEIMKRRKSSMIDFNDTLLHHLQVL